MKRRTVLKGLATGLLAPFFRSAFAQPTPPKRLVIVLECNGIYPEMFLSTGARAAIGAAGIGTDRIFFRQYPALGLTLQNDTLASARALGPLAASGSDASMVERSAVVLGLSSLITGGGHSTGTGALSCAVDGSAPTFDAAMASRLKQGAPFDCIRLGVSASLTPIVYQSCLFDAGKPAPILVNPSLAYQSLFGTIVGGDVSGNQRSMMFDFAADDVRAALATFRGNSNERIKLERYLTSLEALISREAQLKSLADAVRPLLPVEPSANPLITNAGSPADSLMWLEAQFQIATSALLGGLTNNIVLASGSSGFDVHYPSSITQLNRHDLQHGIETPANYTAITQVTTRHVELVAKLARTLAATPEVNASGSMLDHTAILFMSDNGEQHHSEAREWPSLLVGGNALGLKTDGRTVVFPGDGGSGNRQMSNLFNTLGHALGDTSMDMFGREGDTRIAPGPLSELLVA